MAEAIAIDCGNMVEEKKKKKSLISCHSAFESPKHHRQTPIQRDLNLTAE